MNTTNHPTPEQHNEAHTPPRSRMLEVGASISELLAAFAAEFGEVKAPQPVDERRVSNEALKHSVVFDPQAQLVESTRQQLDDIYN